MRTLIVLAGALALAGCADAPPKDTAAQCGPRPTEQQVTDSVNTYLAKADWKDPDSVKIRNVHMQECKGIWKGLVNGGGYVYGWEIDLEANAKNSYGGYTGFQTKSIFRKPDGTITWGE